MNNENVLRIGLEINSVTISATVLNRKEFKILYQKDYNNPCLL